MKPYIAMNSVFRPRFPALLVLLLSFSLCRAQWTKLDSNISGGGLSKNYLVATSTNLFLYNPDGSMIRLSKEGKPQIKVTAGPANQRFSTVAANGNTLFANDTTGMFRSWDNADSWEKINTGLPANTGVYALANCDSILIARAGSEDFRSKNNGDSWVKLKQAVPADKYRSFAAIGSGYFVATAAGLYASPDEGDTWALQGPAVNIYFVMKTENALLKGTIMGLYRSLDSGKTWSVSGILSNGSMLSGAGPQAYATVGKTLFVSGEPGTVIHSADNGATWTKDSSLVAAIQSMAATKSYLFGTNPFGYFWMRPLSDVTRSIKTEAASKAAFGIRKMNGGALDPGTGFEFAISRKGLVDLSLFDAKGARIITLLRTELAPGNHRIGFPDAAPPAGIYFLRLSANGAIDTRRILLSR
jgi:photosystem II stability/assembly factor-like uncharacterized protein